MIISRRDDTFKIGERPSDEELQKIYDKSYISLESFKDYQFLYDSLVQYMREKWRLMYSDYMMLTISESIAFTLYYLTKENLLKKPTNQSRFIRWWKKWHNLGPRYEGIRNGLREVMIAKRHPRAYCDMHRGQMYGSLNLDVIGEAIEYTLEYLHKNKLLKGVDK
jgi:hypothetical protein